MLFCGFFSFNSLFRSGLDAYNSLAVMRLLQNLCKQGKTVICTIHQPRSTIFDMFDQLCVLNFGEVVYFGKAVTAADYFATLGFEIPRNMNPADYIIDVLLSPDRAEFTMKDVSKLDFADSFRKSELALEVHKAVEHSRGGYFDLKEVDEVRPYATSIFKQFAELLKRHWLSQIRDPLAVIIAYVQAVVLAFVVGSIFYQLGYDYAGVQ